MKKPEPQPGLVIRYDYLWHNEAHAGRRDGAKVRPCAIIIARQINENGPTVLVAPITHSPPLSHQVAIEIPQLVKKHLGLDSDRSWIIASEVNAVAWNDPGIVPVSKIKWCYGFLPRGMVKALSDGLLERFRNSEVKMIDRGGISKIKK